MSTTSARFIYIWYIYNVLYVCIYYVSIYYIFLYNIFIYNMSLFNTELHEVMSPCICHMLGVCKLTGVTYLMHGNMMACELSILSDLPLIMWEINSRTRNWTQIFLLSIQCLNYHSSKYYGERVFFCLFWFFKPRTVGWWGVGLHSYLLNNCKCPVTVLDPFECQWLRECLLFPKYSLKLLFLPYLLSAGRNDLTWIEKLCNWMST